MTGDFGHWEPDVMLIFTFIIVVHDVTGPISRSQVYTQIYTYNGTVITIQLPSSVLSTILKYRAKTVYSSNWLCEEEDDHLRQALQRCKWPTWALNRANIKQNKTNRCNQGSSNIRNKTGSSNNKPYIVVPHVKGLSESWKNICGKHGIEMHFRGGTTIGDLLVNLKDRGTILQKSGMIYKYKCGRVNCNKEYIGQSGRTFAERFREHMKAPSPIHDHYNTTDNDISMDNFSIVGREDQSIARSIKEAILIRVNDLSLYRNIGKYQLPHIWDEVLVMSSALKSK